MDYFTYLYKWGIPCGYNPLILTFYPNFQRDIQALDWFVTPSSPMGVFVVSPASMSAQRERLGKVSFKMIPTFSCGGNENDKTRNEKRETTRKFNTRKKKKNPLWEGGKQTLKKIIKNTFPQLPSWPRSRLF